MQARSKNPASALPGATEGVQTLMAAVFKSGVPAEVFHLVHLRASQINGCSACVDGGVKHAKAAGVTDDRLHMVAAWREAPNFSDAERVATRYACRGRCTAPHAARRDRPAARSAGRKPAPPCGHGPGSPTFVSWLDCGARASH